MNKWREFTRKQEELINKLLEVQDELDKYPREGDLIKHKLDHTLVNPEGFVVLTHESWVEIERNNEWDYYEVLRKIR